MQPRGGFWIRFVAYIIDSIIIRPVDVTYDLIWRRGGTDFAVITARAAHAPCAGSSSLSPARPQEPNLSDLFVMPVAG